jgi:hypothetical protein
VKKATSILFSSTLDVTKGNVVQDGEGGQVQPQDEAARGEALLTLAGNSYKLPSWKFVNNFIYIMLISEVLIMQSIILAIIPYLFIQVTHSCSPYNEGGVDCFLSDEAHHGLFAGLISFLLFPPNLPACISHESYSENITMPINCSDFTWYEQYGRNTAQEVPVVCFKISYSDPFLALAILFSFQSFVLPLLFQAVLLFYLKIFPCLYKCCLYKCVCRCCQRCSWITRFILQPIFLCGFFTLKFLIGLVLFVDTLNLFGERISTTVRITGSIIIWLNIPSWMALGLYRVEENVDQNNVQRCEQANEREHLTESTQSSNAYTFRDHN